MAGDEVGRVSFELDWSWQLGVSPHLPLRTLGCFGLELWTGDNHVDNSAAIDHLGEGLGQQRMEGGCNPWTTWMDNPPTRATVGDWLSETFAPPLAFANSLLGRDVCSSGCDSKIAPTASLGRQGLMIGHTIFA